jgi:hypothetical protein
MSKSRYKFIFSIFNVVAIGVIVLFVSFLFIQLKTIIVEATFPEDNTLKVNDKDLEAEGVVQKPVLPAAKDGPKVVTIGEAVKGNAVPAFEWPDENDLIKEALHLFQQHSNWEACLYLTSLQGLDKINEGSVFEYINKYYRNIIADALHHELTKLDRQPEQHLVNIRDLLKSLSMPETLVLVNNIYVYLTKEGVPEQICDVIIKYFLLQVNDPFLKIVVLDILRKNPQQYVSYFAADVFAEKCLALKDKKYLEMYMHQCLSELCQSWNKAGNSAKRWIMNYKTNVDEIEAVKDAVGPDTLFLKERQYNRLSAFHRFLLANYAVNGIKDRTQLNFFSKYGYWSEGINRDKDKYKNMIGFLRQNPRWNYLLNRQHFDKALKVLYKDYYSMNLRDMPEKLKKRMQKMVKVEQELWADNVDGNSWKNIVFAKTKGGRKKLSKRLFWKCLYYLFPKDTRHEDQNALIAACMINRGFNPNVFANLGIGNNIIKKYIPPEEIDDKK